MRVTQGEVFDVAVDVRKDSPTYGKWEAEILSAENKKQLWIPEGPAHGFLVLSDTAEFLYKTTDCYAPALAIQWSLEGDSKLSTKDQQALPFNP